MFCVNRVIVSVHIPSLHLPSVQRFDGSNGSPHRSLSNLPTHRKSTEPDLLDLDLLDLDLLALDLLTLDDFVLRKRWRGLLSLSLLTTATIDAAMNTYARENFHCYRLL